MILKRATQITVILLILFLMTFLLFKAKTPRLDEHGDIVSVVSSFKEINANLNQRLLEAQLSWLHRYDKIVKNVSELKLKAAQAAGIDNGLIIKHPDTTSDYSKIVEVVNEKERLIEEFKSLNSTLKNSQRHITRSIQELRKSNFPAKSKIDIDLNNIYRIILEAHLTTVHDFEDLLDSNVKDIVAQREQIPTPLKGKFDMLVKHINIAKNGVGESRALINKIFGVPMAETIDKFLETYQRAHNAEVQAAAKYRIALFAVALLLALFAGYTSYLLLQAWGTISQHKFALDKSSIVTIADSNWKIIYANDRMSEISHYAQDEIVGADQRLIDGFSDPSKYEEIEEHVKNGDVWYGENRGQTLDGDHYWVSTTVVPYLNENNVPVKYATLRTDISDRKRSEQELELLYKVIEQAADSVVITDLAAEIIYVNKAFEKITGYSRKEVIGKNPSMLKSDVQGPEFYLKMWETLLAGNVWQGRFVNKTKYGKFYIEQAFITPIVNDEGKISQYVAVKHDVTKDEVLQNAKNFFISITSHEMKTPLSKLQLIQYFLSELQKDNSMLSQLPEMTKVLGETFYDLNRIVSATSLISELQLSSGSKSFSKVPLKPLIGSSVGIAKTQLVGKNRDINISASFGGIEENQTLECNVTHIERALQEIMSNAIKFTPDGKDINVHTVAAGGKAIISVIDNGVGLPIEKSAAVKEPFFATGDIQSHHSSDYSFMGGGLGLGLTIVTMVAQSHNGSVNIQNRESGGVEVALTLPLVN